MGFPRHEHWSGLPFPFPKYYFFQNLDFQFAITCNSTYVLCFLTLLLESPDLPKGTVTGVRTHRWVATFLCLYRMRQNSGSLRSLRIEQTSQVVLVVKNQCLLMQETQETRVRSLGWKDPLEEEMATHSSILAQKISWTKEPGRLRSIGSQRVGHN